VLSGLEHIVQTACEDLREIGQTLKSIAALH
jgi:hypothetical protein